MDGVGFAGALALAAVDFEGVLDPAVLTMPARGMLEPASVVTLGAVLELGSVVLGLVLERASVMLLGPCCNLRFLPCRPVGCRSLRW